MLDPAPTLSGAPRALAVLLAAYLAAGEPAAGSAVMRRVRAVGGAG